LRSGLSALGGIYTGTVARNVAFGAAGVARSSLGLRAVSRDVACAGAVVALGSTARLHAIARQVAYTTASVTSLATGTPTAVPSTSVSTPSPTVAASAGVLRAGARDVADLAAAVALGVGAASSAVASSSSTVASSGWACACVGAITRNVAFLAAFIASLGFGLGGTVARDVAFTTAVVAGGSSGLGAACSLVAEAAAVVASSSAHRGSVSRRGV